MKRVVISQRVDVIQGRDERRDALDQRWHGLMRQCGALAMPVPNCPEGVADFLESTKPGAIILSGGNDVANVGGNAPERDATERRLVEFGMRQGLPIIGICRGMQFLLRHFGVPLERLEGHVAIRHSVDFQGVRVEVNSFHTWGTHQPPNNFVALARATDGTLEGMRHAQLPIFAVMWHPERETPYSPDDIRRLRQWLNVD